MKVYLVAFLLVGLVSFGLAAGSHGSIQAGMTVDLSVSPGPSASNNWAGIFGNVTSSYVVGDSNSTFFSWEIVEGRYIYASSSDLNFSGTWKDSNVSEMESQYPFLANGTEEPEETFDTTGEVDSELISSPVTSTAAETFDGAGNPFWKTIYLNDGDSGFFATPVKANQEAFNGEIADYQMILPEDGFANSNGTEYSLYVEVK